MPFFAFTCLYHYSTQKEASQLVKGAYLNFIESVQKEIEKNNTTAYKVCKDLGLHKNTFYGWKNGKTPALDTAIAVAKYLNLSMDEIFELGETTEDKELLRLFHKLPREEQLKEIGRLESKVEELDESERLEGEILSESKIG